MLILSSNVLIEWYNINEEMLVNLVNDGDVWLKNSLEKIEKKGILIVKVKHSKKFLSIGQDYCMKK